MSRRWKLAGRIRLISWRRATHRRRALDRDAKLAVLHAAVEHEFPTGDIEQMLAEIGEDYTV